MKIINKKFICLAIACQFLLVTFISKPIIVNANTIKDEVHISVTDATGEKTSFNYSPSAPSYTESSDIILKGESYGSFSINPSKYNTLQYKIVKSITDSSLLNSEEGWKDINLTEQKNNNDVLIDKKGFLKHRAYDVNHLDSLTGAEKWNNRKIVYETPYSASTIISAKKANTASEYGDNEKYLNGNKQQTRWVNKSIFLNNMQIGSNYKEASKIWGYFKVDETAAYNFQSFSDDGLSAYIIVDGVTHKIVDGDVMFKLHGKNGIRYTQGTNSRTGYEYGYDYKLVKASGHTYDYTATGSLKNVNLDKNKYYPIYIEYFNWGGGAALEMNFKKSNEAYNKYRQIPDSNFYPSKSDYPGEYADSIFTGTDGVKLPSESGRYYIAYRAVNKDKKGQIIAKGEIQGTLGPYLVEPRAKLQLSKSILSSNNVEINPQNNKYSLNEKNFKVKYNITPLPITLEELIADVKVSSDINKAPEEYTMTISDAKLGVILPDGLSYAKSSENSVTEGNKSYNSIKLNAIEYKLDKSSKTYLPTTKTVSFTHEVSAEDYGDYILSEDYNKLTYKDVDGANREIKFDTQNILYGNTEIVKNQLYSKIGNEGKDINDKTVLKSMFSNTLGLNIKVNSLNPEVTIEINGIDNEQIKFVKYELNNGKINTAIGESKTIESKDKKFIITKSDDFKLDYSKEYLIFYEIRPSKDAKVVSIKAIDGNGNEKVNQNIKTEKPPVLK